MKNFLAGTVFALVSMSVWQSFSAETTDHSISILSTVETFMIAGGKTLSGEAVRLLVEQRRTRAMFSNTIRG